jgi:Flp pilus assembly protein TadB
MAGLGLLALTLASGLMLVLDIAVGRLAGIVGTAVLLSATLVFWVLVPLRLRRDSRAAPALPDPQA